MFFDMNVIMSIIIIGMMVIEILFKMCDDNIIKVTLINDKRIIIIEIESNINSEFINIYELLNNVRIYNIIEDIIIMNVNRFFVKSMIGINKIGIISFIIS